MKHEESHTPPGEDRATGGSREPHGAAPRRTERRAEFRVDDNQRSGAGAGSAWSRMSMVERLKRMWAQVRR